VMMVAWTAQGMGSWGLAGAVNDTRQAKRLFPLYGAGLILGGVIGGLATGLLADWIHAENLLFVWAAALGAVHLMARPLTGAAGVARRRRRRGGVLSQMAEGFRDVSTWPLLRWMSFSLVLFAVLYFTLALLFARAATARFPRTDELAGFLGLFMGVSNGAALLVSLLLANRLFARFGMPAMVMALAVIYLVGYGVLAVGATFAALVAFRFVQMVWVNGVWATGWQALFNVVPEERRPRTRSFMDGGPLQAGVVLSGGLLILADRVLQPQHLYVVGAVAAALGAWSMWRARRAYGGALVEALRTGNPDVFHTDQEPFGGFRHDADALAAVVAGTSDPDPAVRRISMEILADVAAPGSGPALVPGLSDTDPQVRAAAVRGLARSGEPLPGEEIGRLLNDPDPGVRANAAGALLGGLDPELGRALGAIDYASSATVTLAYRTADVGARLRGFGFVVPAVDGRTHRIARAIEHLRALYPGGRFEVRRFRPNIVVATGPDQQGFVENDWIGHTLAVGDEVRLRITGPCPRCVMTTLSQGDLPKDPGILRAAAQHNDANVGVYADVIAGGTTRRGDPVTLT